MYNLWYFVAFYAVLLQKVLFFAIYAVFRKIGLLQFTRYCVEKILAQISDRGEKMTNMRYGAEMRFTSETEFLCLLLYNNQWSLCAEMHFSSETELFLKSFLL